MEITSWGACEVAILFFVPFSGNVLFLFMKISLKKKEIRNGTNIINQCLFDHPACMPWIQAFIVSLSR